MSESFAVGVCPDDGRILTIVAECTREYLGRRTRPAIDEEDDVFSLECLGYRGIAAETYVGDGRSILYVGMRIIRDADSLSPCLILKGVRIMSFDESCIASRYKHIKYAEYLVYISARVSSKVDDEFIRSATHDSSVSESFGQLSRRVCGECS